MKITRRGLFSVVTGSAVAVFGVAAANIWARFSPEVIGPVYLGDPLAGEEVTKYYISDGRLIEVGKSKPVGGDPEVGFYGDGRPFIYDKWYNNRHLIIRH